jgi:cellulose synthase/poly-beta-1,6-N-acetylglucosamine synthase-like glycosyltransferase
MALMKILFFSSLLMLVYVYVGYPILVFLLSTLINKKVRKQTFQPYVTILIAAYNEEESIAKTIENKLTLNYPKDRLEIIVISDDSTDRTDEIVRRYSARSVRLLRQEPRNGKTSALNMAVQEAKGEILVFSDANSIYDSDAVRHLISLFGDTRVGYVTGKMIYTNPDGTIVGDGCSAYMKYENFLRKHETKLGSIVGVDGGIDAVRKSLYEPMRADQLPDFILPLKVIEKGYRVVYEPDAILKEESLNSTQDEYRMRVRVSLRSFWALHDMKHLFNLFRYGFFSWQMISHKALRYVAFMILICLYVSNGLMWSQGVIYKIFFVLQNAFYGIAYLGLLRGLKGIWFKFAYFPYYFSLLNIAAGHAFVKFLRGEKQVIWRPRVG